MAKRSAETFAGHESVPTGALPFFVSNAKRVRCSWGSRAPPSPSDPISYYYQANSSSSDDMNDAGATEQADAVSAHHLTTAPSCSSTAWPGGATFHILGSMECLNALGVQPPPHCPFARQFLEQLASCLLGCQLASHGGLSGGSAVAANLGTAFWHAFAELNVLLARHFAELPTSMLRGYHSFTRAPRGQLWQRFLASQGAEMCEGMHVGLPGWLAMTRFLLEYVLAAHPTASCVVYTIEVPPWLRTWCARWNHPAVLVSERRMFWRDSTFCLLSEQLSSQWDYGSQKKYFDEQDNAHEDGGSFDACLPFRPLVKEPKNLYGAHFAVHSAIVFTATILAIPWINC